MIGVIGSEDSVALALRVARELGLSDRVLGRAYAAVDEVPTLARDLDSLCQVLLFTGRVPYERALSLDPPLRATLDYVPHSAIDLYRTLALVMRTNAGAVPAFVVDTIDRSIVEEVCQDLSISTPISVLGLDVEGRGLRTVEDVVAFHVEAARTGRAELSLTCLGAVNQRLRELGLPVSRIEHTRSTLHHALTRASLYVRGREAESAKPAVALLRPAKGAGAGGAVSDLESFARRLNGVLQQLHDGTWCVHTTYAALDSSLLSGESEVPGDWETGYGVGSTLPDAERNARRALKVRQPGNRSATVLADGTVVGVGVQGTMSLRLRETDDQLLAHARAVGVRALTLTRLAVALRDLDPDALTVRELARAYGVEPRSAARLLARLEKAGIAAVRGVDGAPGAGRPEMVYRVDVDRLLPKRS